MLKRFTLIAILLSAAVATIAAPPAQLGTTIDSLVRKSGLDGTVGVHIESLDDGTPWFQRASDDAFVPASTMKVITVSVALEELGPDYTFRTQVLTDGQVGADGTLQGNLILRGGGDPSLTPADLDELAQALATDDTVRNTPAIRRVAGCVIRDESFFPKSGPLLGPGWGKGDLPQAYGAPANALSCSSNALTVTVSGTTAGQKGALTLDPPTSQLKIVNATQTSNKVRTGAITLSRTGSMVRVSGSIAPGAKLSDSVSIPDPARMVEELFNQSLQRAGITVAKGTLARNGASRTMLAEHQSAPLSQIIVPLLKNSDNMYAEQLRWTALSERAQQAPLDKRFQALLEDFAAAHGTSITGVTGVDGSGLSRLNHVTPASLVRVLAAMARSRNFDVFYQALPIAGIDGTLRSRMVGTLAANNAHAKTGTMRGISSLAGYVTTAAGEHLAFAVIANDYTSSASAARALQNDIVTYLANIQ